ncbi:ABC transporter substrate-binding protein [Microbacterium sp.]|uniref:ABC transporter substrate-binding protein n=1 Tax=Microbacterium sp. TaxID=51671 RepID=UPI003A89CB17
MRRGAVGALVAGSLLVTGCASATDEDTTAGGDDKTAAAETAFPVTLDNCGFDVVMESEPERIVLVNNDGLSNLEALGVVDRIVGLTQKPQEGVFLDETYDALESSNLLSAEIKDGGGSVVSVESVLAVEPDLVFAPDSAVDRAALEAAGIAMFSPSAFCEDLPEAYQAGASFDLVWDEVRSYGALVGESALAEEIIADAEDVIEQAVPEEQLGKGAAIYVSASGVLWLYGSGSMVTPVFDAVGLSNVYSDESERVFEVTAEDLIARDPETVVLLYSMDNEQDVIDMFAENPAVAELSAVTSGRIVTLPFHFTDPPSILTARGPAALATKLAELE